MRSRVSFDFVKSVAPTHTCFDDVLDYIENLAKGDTSTHEIRRHVVVHGICVAPDGELFVHAWLELDDAVVQGGIVNGERVFYSLPRAMFRERFPVTEETRYTADQALAENARTGHYGPWVEKYRALTIKKGSEPRTWNPDKPPVWFVIQHDPGSSKP